MEEREEDEEEFADVVDVDGSADSLIAELRSLNRDRRVSRASPSLSSDSLSAITLLLLSPLLLLLPMNNLLSFPSSLAEEEKALAFRFLPPL